MAGVLSNALEGSLLKQAFGAVTYTPPATHYYGLSSTQPTQVGGNVTEPAIGTNGYARVAVTNNTTNYVDASSEPTSGYTRTNGAAFDYPTSSGAWDSGTALPYAPIYDAATGGNFLGYAELSPSVTVSAANVSPSVPAQSLTINLT